MLARYVFPFLLKRWVNKRWDNSKIKDSLTKNKNKNVAKEHEGEIKIKSRGNPTNSETGDMGDYVDYEEVD